MIKKILIQNSDRRITDSLKKYGISIYPVIPNTDLAAPVRCHADCTALRIGDTLFCEVQNSIMLEEAGITSVRIKGIASPYPSEVKLNAKVFGHKILCNERFLSDEVRAFAEDNGYTIIHCNQGYAACSALKVNDRAAITDDETVCFALSRNDVDCLYVRRGSVRLDGYDCGFIGGCSGMIDDNTVVFAGNVKSHDDGEKIIYFLKKHDINIINLFDGELTDFGGFVVLDE